MHIVYFMVCLAAVHVPARAFSARYTGWVRIRTGDPYPSFQARTRRNMVTDSAPGGQKTQAIAALQKLMDRQSKELHETERLLQTLKEANVHDDLLKGGATHSLASSVLSGFDYGFFSRSEGARTPLTGGFPEVDGDAKSSYGPPGNIFSLAQQQLIRNWNAIRDEYEDEENIELTPKQQQLQSMLEQLTLNSTAIWEREEIDGPLVAPLVIKIPYLVLCWFLDVMFEGRYVFSRFFLLETVARMPYFSYITMLHLYETLGFWRRSSDIKRVHFAEEWNEFHHLLIMESLGGDQRWWVRALAQHSAVIYYIVLCILWALSPTLAYKFSELLESHAVNTYGGFLDENEDLLRKLPPPTAAIEYYSLGRSDPFFGEYQTTASATGQELRRPGDSMQSLHDVFEAIRADEGDHVGTMKACLDPDVAVRSPSLERKVLSRLALGAAVAYFVTSGAMPDFGGLDDLTGVTVDATAAIDDGATGMSLVEGLGAAITALGSQLLEDEEKRDAAAVATDMAELRTILDIAGDTIVGAVTRALTVIAEFLAALL